MSALTRMALSKSQDEDDKKNKNVSSSINQSQPNQQQNQSTATTNTPLRRRGGVTLSNINNQSGIHTSEDKSEIVESPEEEKSGVIGTVGNFLGAARRDVRDFLKSNFDIRGGRFELPSAILRGGTEAVAQGVDMFGDVFSKLSFSPYRPYEFAEKDIEQKYGDGNPYSEEVKKRKKELGLTGENIAHKLSDTISEAKEVFPKPQTATGTILEVIAQYATAYKSLGTVMKGGHKALYSKEFLTGFSAFDADEDLLSNFMQDMGVKIPFVTDLLAKDMDDSKFEKRLKTGIEATLLLAPFDSANLIKYIKNVRTHKVNKEQAQKELLENGEVSDVTREALASSAEKLSDASDLSGIQLSPKSAELAEKENWSRNFAKVVEKTEKQKLLKNIENAEVAKGEKEIAEDFILGFEKKLTINKGLNVDDPDFVRISSVKDGVRQLDSKLLVKAKNMELKDETLELSATDAGIEIDEVVFFDKAKRRYRKERKKEDTETLFNKTLTQDNLNALVVIAKKMKDYEGGKYWDTTKKETIKVRKVIDGKEQVVEEKVDVVMRPMESIFNSIVRMGDEGMDMTFGINHPLWDALQDSGMSFEDFAKDALGAVSEAGSTLGKFSQLSNRVKPKNIRQAESLERRLKSQGNFTKFIRRVLDIGRGLMVSAVATAARNAESGLLRSPVEALNNIIETATFDIANGRAIRGNRALQKSTWQDSFRSQRYIYSDRKTAEEFTNLLLRNEQGMKLYNQMFNTINEIQLHTGRGTDMALDGLLSRAEDFTKLVNGPNRWQDFMLRRATFLSEAELLFRKEWDMDLIGELRKGRLNDILNDARDLNPTASSNSQKTIPALDILSRATNKSLDLTYANAPEVNFNRHITEFIVKHNLTGFIAFPRFIFKSMELMAENSAGFLIPPLRRMYGTSYLAVRKFQLPTGKNVRALEEETGLKAGFRKYDQREHRMIARNVTGGLGIMASMMLLREDSDEEFEKKKKEDPNYKRRYDVGQNYKFIEMENGTKLDTSPIFPIRQMLFLGKIFNEYNDAKKDLEPDEYFSEGAALEAITKTFDAREWLETFGGSDFRFGLGGNIIDEAANLFNAEDLMSGRYITEEAGKGLGQFISRYGVPFGQVLDAQRALEQRGLVYKESKRDPEIVNKGGSFLELTSPFNKEFVRPLYRFDAGDMIFDEEEAPVRKDIFRPEGKERRGPLYKLTTGLTMFNAESNEGKKLIALGLTDFELQSKSKIPTIKNFENALITQRLPKIVRLAEGAKKVFEKRYEKKREELSKSGGASIFGQQFGISKEAYVKKMVRFEVLKMINYIRGNEKKLTSLVKRQKRDQIRALLGYKELTTEQRQKGNLRFVEAKDRQPLVITEETALNEIPNYENMNDEEKSDAKKKLLAKDMLYVVRAGKAER
mgnify:FL=1|jgi:hypothetical protein